MSDVTNRACIVDGCAHAVEDRYILCGFHWYTIPRPLRQRVLGQLSSSHASAPTRDRIFRAASSIAADLSATPRRVIHAAKEMARIEGAVTLTSLSRDFAISKKRAAGIIELMIHDGFIDDGDYLGIYHLRGARHENRN